MDLLGLRHCVAGNESSSEDLNISLLVDNYNKALDKDARIELVW
jgi:hypothetical protein